jgi:hypothetical protein
LSGISLPFITKVELVSKKHYTGVEILKGLIEGTLDAAQAAIGFNVKRP